MNRFRKISVVLLIAVFAFTMLLSGCGAKNGASTETSTVSGTAAEQSTQTEQELKPFEIVMVYPGNEQNDTKAVQDEISKIAQQEINATVKLMPIGWGEWTQQTNLMLAGNEKVDLIFTSNYFSYNSLVAKGQIMAIDDLVDKYGQDIISTVEPELLTCSNIGGHMYAVPSIRDFAADFGLIMRKDLVDKYKIDVSSLKSGKDLTAVFKTIKDNEPGVMPTVKGGDITTFAEQLVQGTFDRLDNWFGVLPMNSSDLKIVNMYETKEYADAVNLVRDWFKAGYISKDAATSKEQGTDVVKAGKAFSILVPMKPGYELQVSTQCATPMVAARLTPPITNTSNVSNVMWSISKNTGDADRSMMLLNMFYKNKDLINLFDNGIENVDYVKKSDNIIDYPQGVDASNTGYVSCNWLIGNNYLSYIWNGDDTNLWESMAKFNKESVRSKALGFTFNAEPVKTELAAVSSVQSQYKMGLETGTLDPKVVLPEFISKLKAAGIDKIITEKQSQLDEWAKAKNN